MFARRGNCPDQLLQRVHVRRTRGCELLVRTKMVDEPASLVHCRSKSQGSETQMFLPPHPMHQNAESCSCCTHAPARSPLSTLDRVCHHCSTPRAEVCVHDFEIKKTLRLFKKYPKLFSQCIASGKTGLDHDVRLGHACPWLLHRGKASGGSCAKEARPKLPLRSSTGVSP